jgi:hypothetical protein
MENYNEFKKCPGNSDLRVSQDGRIATKDGTVLKQTPYKKYLIVEDPSKKGHYEFVHRLVALTWLNETFEKGKRMVVHHKDGNCSNNHADNLAWMDGCVHAAAFHGMSVQCEECKEEECEYRYYFQTPPVGDIIIQ